MGIIVSKNARNARRLEPSGFVDEAFLQEFITNNPGILPLDDVDGGDRFLVVAREVDTSSGPIDIVGIDPKGNVYLIETKLFRNADKREVVAQALDYGAALWKSHGERYSFRERLERAGRATFGEELSARIHKAWGASPEDVEEILGKVDDAALHGRFRFVVLMDQLDDRLKRLISFINENSKFDLYAIETPHYRFDEYEVTIPRLYGAEARKEVSAGAQSTRHWDESSFFTEAHSKLAPDGVAALRALYEYFKEHADSIKWGSGGSYGSFLPRYRTLGKPSVAQITTKGELWINFLYFNDAEGRLHPVLAELGERIRAEVPDLGIPPDFGATMKGFQPAAWVPHAARLVEAFRAVLPGKATP